MNEMLRDNLSGHDQAAPTLRSAQISAAGAGRRAVEIAVEEAPRLSVASLPTLLSRVIATLSEPPSTHRSALGLLGMACRMVGTGALLAAAAAARPRWI